MQIQINISTINRVNFDFINEIIPYRSFYNETQLLIINQLLKNTKKKSNSILIKENIKILNEYSKGLSKSRNIGLHNTSAEITIPTDDDVVFFPNLEDTIKTAFGHYPDADIITFQTIDATTNKLRKKYKKKPFKHNIRTLLKVSSIEIAYKTKSINKHRIKYDEKFGLGTNKPTGEETIFLINALRKGLKIYYFPFPLCSHPLETSNTWYNKNLILAKGALFKKIFPITYLIAIILFAITKYKKSNFTFLKFLKLLFKGSIYND